VLTEQQLALLQPHDKERVEPLDEGIYVTRSVVDRIWTSVVLLTMVLPPPPPPPPLPVLPMLLMLLMLLMLVLMLLMLVLLVRRLLLLLLLLLVLPLPPPLLMAMASR
jgi:hypothetical protein